MSIRKAAIHSAAEKLLADNEITQAPVDVIRLAKSLGITVKRQPAEATLSGFLFRNQDDKTTVIGVNSNQHPNRQRFTIAHEIGHYLLHSTGSVHVDRGYSVKLRDSKSSQGTDEEEMEANLFAAELLMPKAFLVHDIDESSSVDLFDEGVLGQLSSRYKVSTQALAFRLAHLGFT